MITERHLEERDVMACADIAREHMTGTRFRSDRPAWRHAEDVAACMEDVRRFLSKPELFFWQGVGWLHDVLEDCEDLDGAGLTGELVERGVDPGRAAAVVAMVEILTKEEGEVETYFQRIRDAGLWELSYVKVADRLMNLQEGKPVFTRKRWNRYVRETKAYVLPMLEDLPDGIRGKLFFVLAMSMFHSGRRGPRQRRKKSTTSLN